VTYNYKRFKPHYYDLAEFPGPRAGEQLVDVQLVDLNGVSVKLTDFLGKPFVIETGSITCPMYVQRIASMKELMLHFNQFQYIVVYVREAHPGNNTPAHSSFSQKLQLANKLGPIHGENRIVLIDNLEGAFHKIYGSLPNMVYLVNPHGMINFRGDWNDTKALESVLSDYSPDKVISQQHYEPARPTPWVAIKTLFLGGYNAFLDFITSIPQLIKLHRKANQRSKYFIKEFLHTLPGILICFAVVSYR